MVTSQIEAEEGLPDEREEGVSHVHPSRLLSPAVDGETGDDRRARQRHLLADDLNRTRPA